MGPTRVQSVLSVFGHATRVLAVVTAASLAGCHLVLEMPPYDPSLLKSLRTIRLAVSVEGKELSATRYASRTEWSARANLIASIGNALSTDGYLVKVSETFPAVPWSSSSNSTEVEPIFTIPSCELAVPQSDPLLEVVAFQLVKSPGEWVLTFIGRLAAAPLLMPFAPTEMFGQIFGAGVTAVRFCLFEAGTGKVAWAYGDWFHSGLDLRDKANADRLVRKAHAALREALARR